jgi:hypothetical protein
MMDVIASDVFSKAGLPNVSLFSCYCNELIVGEPAAAVLIVANWNDDSRTQIDQQFFAHLQHFISSLHSEAQLRDELLYE